jgi:hypothetical protein
MGTINKAALWIKSFFKSTVDWLRGTTWLRLSWMLALALLLAASGQIVLLNNLSTGLGLGLYAVACLSFVTVISIAGKLPPISDEDHARIQRYALPYILGLFGLMLVLYILPRVDNPNLTGKQNYLTIAGWVLGIGCFCAAVLLASQWRLPTIRSIGQSLHNHTWETVFVVGLTITALGLRIIKLDQYPYPVLKDEFTLGAEATGIVQGQYTNLIEPGWSRDPLMSSVPEAIAIGLLGNTVFAVRIAPAIIGALSIVFFYFLARSLFDRLTASLAAFCLLTLPPYLHFSRLGVNNIFAGFWAVVVFWLTYRATLKGRAVDYLLAGLAAGLSFYSYVGNRPIPFLAVGMLLFCILMRRGYLGAQWRQLLVFFAVLTLVSAPLIFYYGRHTSLFLERFRAANIFSTKWLVMEPINSGHSIPVALLEQFRKSTLVFISEGASGGWYYSPQPYFSLLGAIFFVLGLAYSLSHMRELRHLLLQVWFWTTVILGSALITNPPSTERIIGAMPVAALFAAIGLAQVAEMLKRIRLALPRLINGMVIGIMVIISIQGGYYYLGTYQQERTFKQRAEEFELEVSQYVSTLGPDNRLYLLVTLPLESAHFPAHDYLIPGIETQDLDAVTPENIAALPRYMGLIFVAIPERKTELEAVAMMLPGGLWREVARQPVPGAPDEILYYSYQPPAP